MLGEAEIGHVKDTVGGSRNQKRAHKEPQGGRRTRRIASKSPAARSKVSAVAKKRLKKSKEDGNINMNTLPELVLISGVSGTGKSALVMEGVREPSETMGMKFVGGKFDLNNSSMPLSAFVDAMVSLTNSIIESDRGYKIQHDINETFREEEILLLAKTLPGCEVGLFPMQREEIYSKRASQSGGKAVRDNEARLQYETMALMGKSAITCLHNKIRRLLQIICTHLQGVVLFIDDLQVSKNFVNTYTKYFARIMF